VLILVGCNVRGDGDDPAPTATTGTGPTTTAEESAVPTAGPTAPADEGVVNGTPGAGPVSLGGMTVGPVIWATSVDPTSQAPTEPIDVVPEDVDTIYAAVPVSGLAAGTVVAASWTFEGTPLADLATSVTASTDVAETWVAFRLDRVEPATPAPRGETGWPDGEYGVVVTIDGQLVQESVVSVGDAG
jgi:hypothetical protein